MTQFLDANVDKSIGTTGAWTDIDLSNDIPENATGAIFYVVNDSLSSRYYGFRKKGSTDDRLLDCFARCQSMAIVGVDENRKCQGGIESTDVDFFLVGYTESDITMFTNAYDKSIGTTGSWTEIDLSSELPSGAVAAIFDVGDTYTYSREYGLRMNGSSDDHHGDLAATSHIYFIVGVDGDRKIEGYVETNQVDFYLVGYLTAGHAFKNGVDQSLATDNAFVDVTETSDEVCNASGVFGEIVSTTDSHYCIRKKGSDFAEYNEVDKHFGFFAGLDENKKWEAKISSTSCDFYVLGYFIRSPKIREHYDLPNIRTYDQLPNIRKR